MPEFSNPQTPVRSTPKLPSLTSLGQALPPPADSKLPIHSPKVEPDSLTKKQDYKSSPKSHRHPVSIAAGSHKDLNKSEHEHESMCTSYSTKRSMLSTGKEREVGNMMSMITLKAGVHTMGAPLDMSVVQHSSVADPLIRVLLVSVPTRRSGELKEAVS